MYNRKTPFDNWRDRSWGDAREALIRKLVREGATPATIRKQLAIYDAKKQANAPKAQQQQKG